VGGRAGRQAGSFLVPGTLGGKTDGRFWSFLLHREAGIPGWQVGDVLRFCLPNDSGPWSWSLHSPSPSSGFVLYCVLRCRYIGTVPICMYPERPVKPVLPTPPFTSPQLICTESKATSGQMLRCQAAAPPSGVLSPLSSPVRSQPASQPASRSPVAFDTRRTRPLSSVARSGPIACRPAAPWSSKHGRTGGRERWQGPLRELASTLAAQHGPQVDRRCAVRRQSAPRFREQARRLRSVEAHARPTSIIIPPPSPGTLDPAVTGEALLVVCFRAARIPSWSRTVTKGT